jgi:uncharacterized membrane protein
LFTKRFFVLDATTSNSHSSGRSGDGKSMFDSSLNEKIRNLRWICVGVGAMMLFLIMRLVLVIMRNYYNDLYMGYASLYLAATVVPEIVCCGIMVGLVLFTFYQSRHVSLKTLSTNSAYQYQSNSSAEMKNLGPESSQHDDRYDV